MRMPLDLLPVLWGEYLSDKNEFYTLKGYSSMGEQDAITSAMEDYLEMICRISSDGQIVRIKHLSELLHVRPSSASKMAAVLKERGLIEFEKYGHITLTERGERMGAALLHRHELLHRFFCLINQSDNELTLVEKIEHFIDDDTVKNIEVWLDRINT